MTLSYKRGVAQRFSAAAAGYDHVAHLQRTVCLQLFQQLPTELHVADCLDLGAGTGYGSRLLRQRFPDAHRIALDMAFGMLSYMRPQSHASSLLCADMEYLPLKSASIDLIFSSLAVQWSLNFAQTLTQCQRVLRPGGCLAFSTVLEGSLREFKNSWAQVDNHHHINTFRTPTQYQTLCQHSGLELVAIHQHTQRYFYAHLRQLRHELRALGANHLQAARQPHLATRQRLEKLQQAYESYRTPAGLPATWHILYVVLRKPL